MLFIRVIQGGFLVKIVSDWVFLFWFERELELHRVIVVASGKVYGVVIGVLFGIKVYGL